MGGRNEKVFESIARYFDWHGKYQTTMGQISDHRHGANVVLDLGGGTGWLAEAISKMGVPEVIVADIDSVVLTLNQSSRPGVRGVLATSDRLPFDDESVDFVVAKDIIEHLINPLATVLEVARVLRPGGEIYVATPTVGSKTFHDGYTHVRAFNIKSMTSLLEDAGFTVEKSYYTGSYPGIGKWMKWRNTNRMPNMVFWLASLGVRMRKYSRSGNETLRIMSVFGLRSWQWTSRSIAISYDWPRMNVGEIGGLRCFSAERGHV